MQTHQQIHHRSGVGKVAEIAFMVFFTLAMMQFTFSVPVGAQLIVAVGLILLPNTIWSHTIKWRQVHKKI